jgi:hypothetical protein
LNVLALLLAQTGRHSKAEKYFIEAIRIFPSSDATYYNYGLALKALSRPAEALDMFSRSLAINPRSSDSWNNRGTVRSDLGGFQSAIADEVWMRLLAGIQGSVLRLSRTNDRAAANLRSAAQAHGIDPDRIVFASRVASLADHLARQRLADLFLDTLPYNAHSTANDAVRAGVPVLTCIGQAFAGRVAASMLRAVTLPELVARNLEEYEAMARRLARRSAAAASHSRQAHGRLADLAAVRRGSLSQAHRNCLRHDVGALATRGGTEILQRTAARPR